MPSLRRALLSLLALGAVATAQDRPPLAPVVAEQAVGSLPLRLNLVALPSYGPDEVVRLKLFLKNVSGKPLALRISQDDVSYSILVQDRQGGTVTSCESGELTARRSTGRVLTLRPGQAWSAVC